MIDSFTADQLGHLEITVIIPANTTEGDHELSLCWSNQCRVGTTIHVTRPVPIPSPTPSAHPTPSPTAAPTAAPTPTPGPGRVSVSPVPLRAGGQINIVGSGFTGSQRTIYLVDSAGGRRLADVTISPNGAFAYQGVVPTSVTPPQVLLKVCILSSAGSLSDCVDETIAVTK